MFNTLIPRYVVYRRFYPLWSYAIYQDDALRLFSIAIRSSKIILSKRSVDDVVGSS